MFEIVDDTVKYHILLIVVIYFHFCFAEEEFVKEFRTCFQNATERMEKSHRVEDLRKNLASLSVVI